MSHIVFGAGLVNTEYKGSEMDNRDRIVSRA